MTPARSRVPKAATAALLLLALTLVCGVKCGPDQTVNPDLKLILRDEGHYPFNPAVSPDGRLVYFLDDTSCKSAPPFDYGLRGDVRVLRLRDSADRLLCAGNFYRVALSSDGTLLAVAVHEPEVADSILFVVVDTAGAVRESLRVSRDRGGLPNDMAFLADDQELVYNQWRQSPNDTTYFYTVVLGDSVGGRPLFQLPWHQSGFDVFSQDSIYADRAASVAPAVHPDNARWVVFSSRHATQLVYEWQCHDRHKDEVVLFGDGARPPDRAYVGMPCWMPDGRGLVFVAAERTGPTSEPYECLELWYLVWCN